MSTTLSLSLNDDDDNDRPTSKCTSQHRIPQQRLVLNRNIRANCPDMNIHNHALSLSPSLFCEMEWEGGDGSMQSSTQTAAA